MLGPLADRVAENSGLKFNKSGNYLRLSAELSFSFRGSLGMFELANELNSFAN